MARTIAAHIIVLFLTGCFASGNISYRNLSYLYKQEQITAQPDYSLLNTGESLHRVYFTVSRKKLLYSKDPSGNHFTAKIEICCKVLTGYQSFPTDTICKFFI